MEYDIDYFDEFFENPDSLSTEEYLEKCRAFLELMKTNQEKYGFTDKQIAEAGEKILAVDKAYEAEKKSYRELEIADKKLEQTIIDYDDLMAEIMEQNGGKPIPLYINLPKKRGSN